jgi:tripartite-type tricarboxylate transporter receptor subunit TctC
MRNVVAGIAEEFLAIVEETTGRSVAKKAGRLARQGLVMLLWAAAVITPSAQAADTPAYPNRLIKIVLAYEAGGSVDFLARKLSEALSIRLGQPVIVEPRPGANERIASQYLLSQPADGYNLLLVAVPHATNATLFPNLPYDTRKSFAPVILLADVSQLVVVRADSEYKTFADVVKAAKAKPGQVSYGSPGIATGTHLMMEMLNQLAGIEMLHVPYKGLAPLTAAILGGHTDVGVYSVSPQLMGLIESGRVRALGIPRRDRWSALPNVPTFGEQGYPEAIGGTWFGLLAKAGTPPEIVQRLNREINAILATPDVKSSMVSIGMNPVGGTPEQFGTHIGQEIDRWGKVIRSRNIRIE